MLSDEDVRYHLRQAEIAVEVTEHEGETTMPFRPGYILELLQQIKSERADNAALRARLADVERERDDLTIRVLADGIGLVTLREQLAEATPIIAYAASGYGVVGMQVPQIAENARAYQAKYASDAPVAVEVSEPGEMSPECFLDDHEHCSIRETCDCWCHGEEPDEYEVVSRQPDATDTERR